METTFRLRLLTFLFEEQNPLALLFQRQQSTDLQAYVARAGAGFHVIISTYLHIFIGCSNII